MRFLVVTKHKYGGVTYHRLTTPFRHLERQGHSVEYILNLNEIEVETKNYDYLVFNRGLGHGLADISAIKMFKDAGVKVIVDIDDYWNLPDHHPIVWRDDINYQDWRDNIVNNILIADYIWTSTIFLQSKIREINSKVPIVVAKNVIDYDEEQWCNISPSSKKVTSKVNIGYVGSTSHYMDLESMRRAFHLIHRTKWLDKNLLFHLIGTENSTDYGRKVWHQFADVFTCNRKYMRNIKTHPGVRVNQYAYNYDILDISIASLADNEFNKAKSELKVIEAGAKKVPFIGTNMITYSRTNANIDLCDTPEEWYESVKELSTDKSLRVDLGEELHDYVRAYYNMDFENEERLSILD